MLKQFKRDFTSNKISDFLGSFYTNYSPCKQSFFAQINEVHQSCGINIEANFKSRLEAIDSNFICNDLDLRNQVTYIISSFNIANFFINLKTLNETLRVNFWILIVYLYIIESSRYEVLFLLVSFTIILENCIYVKF